MSNFRLTHEKYKLGQLTDEQKKQYLGMREELARSLVNSQSVQVPDGKTARQCFRVAQMYKLELDRTYQTMTTQVSLSGFSCGVQSEMKVGQKVGFAITLKRDLDPIRGEARVVQAGKSGLWRLSLDIVLLNDAYAEQLETALFDAVLARFK